jgi:hypothetical protein
MALTTIAGALVTALKAAGFTEAERRPVPYLDRQDCASRKCVVIIRNLATEDGHRADDDQIVDLSIAIQKAVGNPHSNTEVDALIADVETLRNLWSEGGALRHVQLQGATYDSGPMSPGGSLYLFNDLIEANLFSSITLVKYRIEA